ncbi:MAG: hypothetical protein ABGZ24_17005, partial [Fuerstiella sp.]
MPCSHSSWRSPALDVTVATAQIQRLHPPTEKVAAAIPNNQAQPQAVDISVPAFAKDRDAFLGDGRPSQSAIRCSVPEIDSTLFMPPPRLRAVELLQWRLERFWIPARDAT